MPRPSKPKRIRPRSSDRGIPRSLPPPRRWCRAGAGELESEAESDRAVYTAFLNRAKEVGEQQDLNDTNSRIITRAVPPTAKSSPPRTLIVAGSFILGLIGGGMIGLLREQFNPTIISARELATDFRMRVLAELSNYTDAPSPVFASETP